MGWMSAKENVLPGKTLTSSALLPMLCLALLTPGYVVSHQLAAAPETMDRLKMHPSGVQKGAAGKANGTGQSVFSSREFLSFLWRGEKRQVS